MKHLKHITENKFNYYLIIIAFSMIIGRYAGNLSMQYQSWFLIPGVIAFFLLIAGVFARPFQVFLALIILRPLVDKYLAGIRFMGENLLSIYSLFYIFFIIVVIIRSDDIKIFPKNIRPFYILIIFSILSLPGSIDLFTSTTFVLRFLSLLSIYLLTYNFIKTKEDATRIIRTVVLYSIIPLLYGIYQFLFNIRGLMRVGDFFRVQSTFSHPNTYAYYVLIIFFFNVCLFYLLRDTKKRKYCLLLNIPILVSIVLTYTRSAWIGLFVGVFVLAILEKRMRLPLFISILLFGFFFYPVVMARFDDILNPSQYGNSLTFRFDIWNELINNAFIKRPLLGFGGGTSKIVSEALTEKYSYNPHNDYIRLILDVGIMGTVPYLVFIFYNLFDILVKIRKRINRQINIAALGVFMSLIVCSISDNIIYYVSVYGYFLILLATIHKLNVIGGSSSVKDA